MRLRHRGVQAVPDAQGTLSGRIKSGRDWFYGLMHESHLMLKPGKRHHTTSSNHPYRKYKNMIKD